MSEESKEAISIKHGIKTPRITDDFLGGLAAAFVNTCTLFPLNKLIFRQMAGGYNVGFAADQLKDEGESLGCYDLFNY